MNTYKPLKIIAVNLLNGCKPHIRKNLDLNSPYIFHKQFKLVETKSKNQYIIQKNDNYEINYDFFKHNPSDKPNISINAIVGKNGSGKSAIIDVILRLINNLAFKHIPNAPTYTNADLKWIAGIRAQFFFIMDENHYQIQQDGDDKKNIALYKYIRDKKNNFNWRRVNSTKKALGESFFYTILMNYSLYAFNTFDYKEEWEIDKNEGSCWLKGLFHKNDGYQTPAVLNPMRTKGNIEINRENSLAKDRLISLFFNEIKGNNKYFTEISESCTVVSIQIKFASENVNRKYQKLLDDWKDNSAEIPEDDFFDFLKHEIISEWKKKYKIQPLGENDNEYEISLKYLVYKTISIAQTYDSQFENSDCLIPFNSDNWNDKRKYKLRNFITELDKETSHVIFKIRQILAFLEFRHIGLKNDFRNIPIKEFSDLVANKISNKWKYLDFVPSPIFETEIMIKNSGNGEVYSFSKLSSGERQLIFSASSILYHIRNINSVQRNLRRIKYRNLNIILDEIELYFHPEYQRRYIDYLIKTIRSLDFEEIENINILLATHSPFILSDIPETNVLFLDEGSTQQGISETFGSNIHSLYKNSFFISEMPIGEFAKNKITSLFEQVRNIKTSDEKLYSEINIVGEPLLKSQLLKSYHKNAEVDLNQKIEKLEEEIKVLKSRNNDSNPSS